jgi:hypothetical protein
MNFVIKFLQEKTDENKSQHDEKNCFSQLERALIAKSKVFVSKTKGLEGSTWIKNGVVVKKQFKDWKAFQLQLPKKKVDPS